MAVPSGPGRRKRLYAVSAERLRADVYRRASVVHPSLRGRPGSLFDFAVNLFDFAGVFSPRVRISPPGRSDAEALAADWEAVGNDLWAAIGAVKPEPTKRGSTVTR